MLDILKKQEKLFTSTLSLIPSENYSFYDDFQKVFQTDIANRYSFVNNPMFSKAFPGNTYAEECEREVEKQLKGAFKASHINLSPLSGMNALTILLASVGNI